MERKFMVYQRRDGFQIAEEATGTRLENGLEFLARPHKSAKWCATFFNIDLNDDGYELVGEEMIDCSACTHCIEFVDGVMRVYSFGAYEIEKDHAEALEINTGLDAALLANSRAENRHIWNFFSDDDKRLAIIAAHAEALKMDTAQDESYRHLASQIWFSALGAIQQRRALAAAHAEALKMNAALNEAFRIAQVTRAEFYLHNVVFQRYFIAAAHEEALKINLTRGGA